MGFSKGKWSQNISKNKIKTISHSKQIALDLDILLQKKDRLISYAHADLENKYVKSNNNNEKILQDGERFFKNHLNQASSFYIPFFRLWYCKQTFAEKHWQVTFWWFKDVKKNCWR